MTEKRLVCAQSRQSSSRARKTERGALHRRLRQTNTASRQYTAAYATSHTLRLNYSQNAPQTRREAAKLKSNRISKDSRRSRLTRVFLILCVSSLYSPAAFALPEVAAASLKNELRGRVLSQYPDAKISVELMDKQELFKPCDAPTTEVSGQNITGRIPVRVRCNGASPWSYFVQAHVAALEQIIVARHPIKRGMVIGADDLVQIETEIDPRRRYYTSTKPIVGSLAARSITSQQPIQARYLDTPLAVKRGDNVIIRARFGSATISTNGEALKSGHVGDQIPVKNVSSKRTIHTWITGKGRVDTRVNPLVKTGP